MAKAKAVQHTFKDRTRYDWTSWADGGTYQIKRGTHYTVATASMMGAIYKHAERNEQTVQVEQTAPDQLTFKFSKPKRGKS